MQVNSPFDYAQQAALYVPPHLPRPGDPAHASQVASLVLEALAILGGRTLVLTTTLNAMRSIGEQLQAQCDGGVEVLVQGQSPKRRLMERFREGGGLGDAHGRTGCVLVASASFWEGFDVPGDALQLVVIDKLPFPPPGDPLFEARSQRITQQGKSAFADHALPEAAVSLKQGAGRLIRSETDVIWTPFGAGSARHAPPGGPRGFSGRAASAHHRRQPPERLTSAPSVSKKGDFGKLVCNTRLASLLSAVMPMAL
jgi:ATP-dependent DNA helicase DinG